MALTPLDIQNKNFSTKMRGYNQDDVDDFLDQVTKDYEDALQKNRELEKSLKHAEEKLQYFNELKDALNQSIIVAQDTADKVKTSANKESEVIVTSAENTANEMISSAEKRSTNLVASAEEKAKEILTDATDRARQLAAETDDLKKKTRVFHQRLSLMLETQLEQVKSEEWNELLKPFSSYVSDSHTVIKEVLAEELDKEDEASASGTVTEPVVDEQPTLEQAAIDPKAMLDLLNKEPK
ncbi:DivIVA domain-containing protein [Enterococcus sp. DIV0242_7C1]|uniref:Cell division protein DivIVA n=1 Tax=Candidatus Enterococcus dunnyi TaxID=1834192 RepID=A0A200J7N1_9ENTE|nr:MULTISPECIES: DivIVA domain-containing protein [unclassified Enterococcus]MBO0470787.1 DivIVA domain-containing protein [Enterococcus sp. DIV0242_7C1]MCA5012459.1 DivIVA domain-containing protein [Enterococcus sp. S23]MCA5015710.1 DivIVA domain-containing protein [Enterococcus sp. S22(2020)]OUZ33233.1 cell division protein DivIVA [Enterococcus sp. 9D6_DIV0238]